MSTLWSRLVPQPQKYTATNECKSLCNTIVITVWFLFTDDPTAVTVNSIHVCVEFDNSNDIDYQSVLTEILTEALQWDSLTTNVITVSFSVRPHLFSRSTEEYRLHITPTGKIVSSFAARVMILIKEKHIRYHNPCQRWCRFSSCGVYSSAVI